MEDKEFLCLLTGFGWGAAVVMAFWLIYLA